jgi:tetratricopeptide (TPR) repeat protein
MKRAITIILFFCSFNLFSQQGVFDYYNRANVQLQYKNYNDAITLLDQALIFKRNYAEAFAMKGDCYYYLKDYPNAIENYKKAGKIKENLGSYNLACTYALSGLANEAFKTLEANLGSEYKLRMTHVAQDGDLQSLHADPRWEPLTKKQWYSPYEALLNDAEVSLNGDDLNAAIELLSKAIQMDPKKATAYGTRAICHLRNSDFQKSLEDLNEAITLDPKSMYYGNRAYANNKLGNIPAALADYEKSVQLDPTNLVYYDLAIARYQNGKKQSALTAMQKHISYYPKDEMGLYFGGIITSELEVFDESLSYFNKALEVNNTIPDIYLKRGDVFFLTKKFKEAVTDYSKVIELDPKNGGAYYVRGNAKGSLYDKKGACEDWRKAEELGFKDANGYIRDLCK